MSWGSRIPARTPRKNSDPYPVQFFAICACGWKLGTHDLKRAEGAAYTHGVLTEHEAVEIIRAEDLPGA